MQDKIKNYIKDAYFYAYALRDVRVAGRVLFLIIVMLITWSGIKSIQTNYELQQRISKLQQQTAVQKLSNANLKLQNQYFMTDTYLELTARQNFGKAAAGETELLVSENAALAYTVDTSLPKSTDDQPAQKHQPTYQRNFQAWVDFFMHRQQ
jgi:cell division protein FtsB